MIEKAFKQVSIQSKNQILDESPAKDGQVNLVDQASADSKKSLSERVGDWVCLNCSNLNFSFRDVCNRCEMDRMDVGKTIMNKHELESVQAQQQATNTAAQINIKELIAAGQQAMQE